MRRMNSNSVDLIYLDPPFNSKANYAAPIGSKAAGAEFRDTWYLDDIDKEWIQSIAKKHPKLYRVLLASMNDSDKAYLAYMSPRMIEMERILKPNGSIYLHCDPTMSHYLKMAMDAIFGRNKFCNEIIWHYGGNSEPKKSFPKKHDVILCYSGKGATFNRISIPYAEATLRRYNHVDNDGRRYKISALRDGKQEKVYMKEGKAADDVWTDIPVVRTKNERTGYPTQKPLALLDRIIDASSNEGDIVFDPFCGCATTLVSAEFRPQRRQWVGIDISPKAVELVIERIEEKQGMYKDIIPRKDMPQRTDIGKLPNPRIYFKQLYGNQEGYCNGCEKHYEPNICEVDHIIAKSKGGTDHVDNLQMLCRPCNMKKGNKSMEYLTFANKRLKEILEIM